MPKTFFSIFRQGSRTYFYSSLFFPKHVRHDVFVLYSFVRVADNYVDSIPQQAKKFHTFRKEYQQAIKGKESQNHIIQAFVELQHRKKIPQQWITAFLDAMEQDLHVSTYSHLHKTEHYMYGSAEVIGLMMAKILDLPASSYPYAQLLGKSMQFVNFIRDIEEDLRLGRQYLPTEHLRQHRLQVLDEVHTRQYPQHFTDFIHQQVDQYLKWDAASQEGFRQMPKRYAVPIQTAAAMYRWTAQEIRKNPFVVYQKKVKPSIMRIISTIVYYSIK